MYGVYCVNVITSLSTDGLEPTMLYAAHFKYAVSTYFSPSGLLRTQVLPDLVYGYNSNTNK